MADRKMHKGAEAPEFVMLRLPLPLAREWKQHLIIERLCGNDTDLSMKLGRALMEALGEAPSKSRERRQP